MIIPRAPCASHLSNLCSSPSAPSAPAPALWPVVFFQSAGPHAQTPLQAFPLLLEATCEHAADAESSSGSGWCEQLLVDTWKRCQGRPSRAPEWSTPLY